MDVKYVSLKELRRLYPQKGDSMAKKTTKKKTTKKTTKKK